MTAWRTGWGDNGEGVNAGANGNDINGDGVEKFGVRPELVIDMTELVSTGTGRTARS